METELTSVGHSKSGDKKRKPPRRPMNRGKEDDGGPTDLSRFTDDDGGDPGPERSARRGSNDRRDSQFQSSYYTDGRSSVDMGDSTDQTKKKEHKTRSFRVRKVTCIDQKDCCWCFFATLFPCCAAGFTHSYIAVDEDQGAGVYSMFYTALMPCWCITCYKLRRKYREEEKLRKNNAMYDFCVSCFCPCISAAQLFRDYQVEHNRADEFDLKYDDEEQDSDEEEEKKEAEKRKAEEEAAKAKAEAEAKEKEEKESASQSEKLNAEKEAAAAGSDDKDKKKKKKKKKTDADPADTAGDTEENGKKKKKKKKDKKKEKGKKNKGDKEEAQADNKTEAGTTNAAAPATGATSSDPTATTAAPKPVDTATAAAAAVAAAAAAAAADDSSVLDMQKAEKPLDRQATASDMSLPASDNYDVSFYTADGKTKGKWTDGDSFKEPPKEEKDPDVEHEEPEQVQAEVEASARRAAEVAANTAKNKEISSAPVETSDAHTDDTNGKATNGPNTTADETRKPEKSDLGAELEVSANEKKVTFSEPEGATKGAAGGKRKKGIRKTKKEENKGIGDNNKTCEICKVDSGCVVM